MAWVEYYISNTTTGGSDCYFDRVLNDSAMPEEKSKEDKMRSLFDVYVVDPRKRGKMIGCVVGIIADNQEQALLKANVAKIAGDAELELEQVDVYAHCIGTFIRPRKDTQRVKVVREKDEE